MSEQHTQGLLYIRTNRHPNTDGTAWGWVDLNPPGSMRQASPDGVQITWSKGCRSEANARRLVACWNALVDLPQSALDGGWTRAGLEAYGLRLEAQRDELLAALKVAEQSVGDVAALETVRAAIAKVEGGAE